MHIDASGFGPGNLNLPPNFTNNLFIMGHADCDNEIILFNAEDRGNDN